MIDIAKWSFAVGHVFNDLCASMWFLFTLAYFTKVLNFENAIAGDIMLIGQISDAIATPLIGMASDKKGFICGNKVGPRKSWHLLGTVLTAISFPFIFTSFFNSETTFGWYLFIYYTPFVVIFQFAWAAVQVTHLSLIPLMVLEGKDNGSLNSLRNMFTLAANVAVLLSTTLLFYFNQSPSTNKLNESNIVPSEISLNSSDKSTFTYLSIGVVIIGLIFSIVFQICVQEKKMINSNTSCEDDTLDGDPLSEKSRINRVVACGMSRRDWFREPQFYLINLIYLVSRLIVNVSQVYLVIYVIDSLGFTKMNGPLAALTTFLSGAVASIILKIFQRKIGKKICFLIGLLFIALYCIMVAISKFVISFWILYLSMVILGIGSSVIIIGSLSLTADLIADSCSSSAFVYGCMSFSDKLFSGIIIWLLQRYGPEKQDPNACKLFYLYIQLYFIGSCVAFALVILLIMSPMKIGIRRYQNNTKINWINNNKVVPL